MDDTCGKMFEEATRHNTTLIDFEFGFNNFHLENVILKYFILFRLEKYKIT